MKEKFKTPQTAIRWLFAGFTLLCLLAAVISAILYRWSASDVFAGLGPHLYAVRPDRQELL